MFLPPDLRDWVPANHIVHFILEAVEEIPESAMHINWRGSGSAQYPPSLMLALLIYSYCTGRFSSREIEAATASEVALRYLCAGRQPDHDTICKFRNENRVLFKKAFCHVLEIAAEMKVFKQVGSVSIDGSKMLANASKHAAVSYERAGEKIAQLEWEVETLLQKAEAADRAARETGLDIPKELELREKRLARLKEARAVLEERAKERAAQERVEYEAKLARRAQREAEGRKPGGRAPQPPEERPAPKEQYNFTDPESRIMKTRSGFEQCYNGQLAVDAEGSLLIVGEHLSAAPNDKEQLLPGVASIDPAHRQATAVLVDSGFMSAPAIAQVEAPAAGQPRKTVYGALQRESHHRTLAQLEAQEKEPEPLPAGASAPEKMAHRLATPAGRKLYALRKQTVEPVFGIIKETMGFRRFSLRGKANAAREWTLVCLAYNMKRLHRLAQHAASERQIAASWA